MRTRRCATRLEGPPEIAMRTFLAAEGAGATEATSDGMGPLRRQAIWSKAREHRFSSALERPEKRRRGSPVADAILSQTSSANTSAGAVAQRSSEAAQRHSSAKASTARERRREGNSAGAPIAVEAVRTIRWRQQELAAAAHEQDGDEGQDARVLERRDARFGRHVVHAVRGEPVQRLGEAEHEEERDEGGVKVLRSGPLTSKLGAGADGLADSGCAAPACRACL